MEDVDRTSLPKRRKAKKIDDEVTNPCLKESNLSHKCMADNSYDKDRCVLYFENYRNCMKFWSKISGERRRKGIEPYMPLPDQRDQVKQEFLKRMSGKT